MLRFEEMGPGHSGDGQGHVGNPAKATALFDGQILDMQIGDAVRADSGAAREQPPFEGDAPGLVPQQTSRGVLLCCERRERSGDGQAGSGLPCAIVPMSVVR